MRLTKDIKNKIYSYFTDQFNFKKGKINEKIKEEISLDKIVDDLSNTFNIDTKYSIKVKDKPIFYNLVIGYPSFTNINIVYDLYSIFKSDQIASRNNEYLFNNLQYKILLFPLFLNIGNNIFVNYTYFNQEYKTKFLNTLTKLDKLTKDELNTKHSLDKLFMKCNTINQFSKVWPQSEHVLKALNLDELVHKKQKRKRTELNVNKEDIDQLNITLLKNMVIKE